eukprot:scaffold7035_cov62-Phaeocystis_antarctica.AAC.3
MRRAHPHPHSPNDAVCAAVPRQPECVTCTHSVAMAAEPKVHPPNSARSRCPVDMARNQTDSARGSPPCLVVRYRVSTSDRCDTNDAGKGRCRLSCKSALTRVFNFFIASAQPKGGAPPAPPDRHAPAYRGAARAPRGSRLCKFTFGVLT